MKPSLTNVHTPDYLTAMAQLPELMTVPEIASAFRINEETVRKWARDGRLSPIPLPTRILRFRREDVEALLSGQTVEAHVA